MLRSSQSSPPNIHSLRLRVSAVSSLLSHRRKQNHEALLSPVSTAGADGRASTQQAIQVAFADLQNPGDTGAQYDLGLMYAEGQGVSQDYVQAHKWINLAVDQLSAGVVHDQAVKARDLVPEDSRTPASRRH